MKTLKAQITDANNRVRGVMDIQVHADHIGPLIVIHSGHTYSFTGKSGTHIASGVATREMATSDDARIWITLCATCIFED